MFNSLINVYKTEWLDLVFADRNKNYGAYELRSKSSSIMTRALFVSGSLFILLCFSPLIYAKLFPKEIVVETPPTEVKLDNIIHQMKPKTPEPEKKVEPAKADPVKVKTIAVPSQVVVVNKTELPPPPTVEDIKNAGRRLLNDVKEYRNNEEQGYCKTGGFEAYASRAGFSLKFVLEDFETIYG